MPSEFKEHAVLRAWVELLHDVDGAPDYRNKTDAALQTMTAVEVRAPPGDERFAVSDEAIARVAQAVGLDKDHIKEIFAHPPTTEVGVVSPLGRLGANVYAPIKPLRNVVVKTHAGADSDEAKRYRNVSLVTKYLWDNKGPSAFYNDIKTLAKEEPWIKKLCDLLTDTFGPDVHKWEREWHDADREKFRKKIPEFAGEKAAPGA